MDEKYIVNVLSNKNRILEKLQSQREELLQRKQQTDKRYDDVIRQISLKGKPIKADVLSPTNAQNNNMLSILRRSHRELRKQENEIDRQLGLLNEEEQRVKHIWNAFKVLESQDFKILNEIYVKKIKYDYLCTDYQKNKSTLYRKRSDALEKLNIKVKERLKNYLLEDNDDCYWN